MLMKIDSFVFIVQVELSDVNLTLVAAIGMGMLV